MNKNLEMQLVEKHPVLYRDYDGDPKKTCMTWGFLHEDGWFKIIEDMSEKLDAIARKYEIRIIAVQVKEKFGILYVY